VGGVGGVGAAGGLPPLPPPMFPEVEIEALTLTSP